MTLRKPPAMGGGRGGAAARAEIPEQIKAHNTVMSCIGRIMVSAVRLQYAPNPGHISDNNLTIIVVTDATAAGAYTSLLYRVQP